MTIDLNERLRRAAAASMSGVELDNPGATGIAHDGRGAAAPTASDAAGVRDGTAVVEVGSGADANGAPERAGRRPRWLVNTALVTGAAAAAAAIVIGLGGAGRDPVDVGPGAGTPSPAPASGSGADRARVVLAALRASSWSATTSSEDRSTWFRWTPTGSAEGTSAGRAERLVVGDSLYSLDGGDTAGEKWTKSAIRAGDVESGAEQMLVALEAIPCWTVDADGVLTGDSACRPPAASTPTTSSDPSPGIGSARLELDGDRVVAADMSAVGPGAIRLTFDYSPQPPVTAPPADRVVADSPGELAVGRPMPFTGVDGFAELGQSGTPTVVMIGARWCPHCAAAVARMESDGLPAGVDVAVIFTDTRTDVPEQIDDAAIAALEARGIAVGQDHTTGDSSVVHRLGIESFPTWIAVDADGIVRAVETGDGSSIADLAAKAR